MDYQDITVQTLPGRVGVITLNRPKALNALRGQLMTELLHAVKAYDADDGVGAIVIAGSERAFSAGADIKEMADATPVSMLNSPIIERWHQLRAISKPIIAAVSGFCFGGGNELAMSCDMIVASESAIFGQPEINIGVIPGAGGTQRLTKAVGKAIAMEMVLNDRRLTAQEALQYGLVNKVVPVAEFLDSAIALAAGIASRAPVAVRLGKEAVNKAFELSLSEGLSLEQKYFYYLFATEDQKEGMAAFVEKRPAVWQGK
ncbi:MAG: enoyl-CoA hydratase/isomerase family protein [Caldilineaceae bacterium]|nr:enoyl-CoA hydratase/isomerase family protein [Caldilineaceae bacterium]MBP8108711.1 enoyl-CoA hydratase/isomerase family protein [Caldilineaceae bacterium]MBP8121034.1 enoyl-CoA hydratase/isomerase family protein [Caldilineaceae bacterium]MBP9073812.1 enoyl-CoA hydratase/isomerase family protein [Caldilineaceae bacterium]